MLSTQNRVLGISLRDLLGDVQFLGANDIRATSVCGDSRKVQPGDLFVALPGVEHDGHDHSREALERGAAALLVERHVPSNGLPLCLTGDVRGAYGAVCHALVGNPSRQLKTIGITGTNGKTTTTALTAGVLSAAGGRVGTIGTLGINDTVDYVGPSLTTPPAMVSAHWLSRMVVAGCSHGVMEVSSHALSQSRVAGIQYDAVCFTNIRRDHLDYHSSLVNYRRTKARLLDYLSPEGVVIVNQDDPECARLMSETHHPVKTISMGEDADVTGTIIEQTRSEQTFLINVGSESAVVRTAMIGTHHVYNCLCATALGLTYGIDLPTIVRGLESVEQVPGRMERIECGQPFSVYVDYAHTPDALTASLKSLRQVTQGRLLCVFGAGGDRDPRKRSLMGAAVEREADISIVTTDNPRTEDPADIAQDVLSGFQRPKQGREILNREQAIRWAIREARPGDSVLIAGKGHEDYQVIGRQKFYFDDREVARECLYHLEPETASLRIG